jgi:DNA-binding CsgD family transcriptional regulator
MLARELAAAEPWGRKAIELADELGDDEILASALIQSGVARWMAGLPEGLDRLRRGVDLARRVGRAQEVVHGLSQIGSGGGEVRNYREAIEALEECVAYADRHDLGSRGLYAKAWLARCRFDLGQWDEASAILGEVLRSPRCEGITRITALTVLGRLRCRRNDPDVWPALDEALDLARRTGHLQRLWPVAAARAEAAWLEGRLSDEIPLVDEVHALAAGLAYPWAVGELALWLGRSGRPVDPGVAAPPFALELTGDFVAAAAAWSELGCPYEAAWAKAGTGDAGELAAMAAFEQLGAAAARVVLVERRRAAGRLVPRGPNAATRGNPAGLTDRELDVLRLVAAGLTNASIASRLHISEKTVGHHVSHALGKLSSRSRAEAVAAMGRLGIPLTT